MIHSIIFDLDGTLLDTLDDLADSCNMMLKTLGYPILKEEDIKGFVGNGISRLVELALPKGKENPNFEKAVSLMKKIYETNCTNKTLPYPGIKELLSELFNRKIGIGIVSNKPDAQVKSLASFYFPSIVQVAIGDSEGRKRKPAPDSVLEAIHLLGGDEKETLYVGDSEVDILTSKNAGLRCISVTWGFRSKEVLLENGAETLIDSPLRILDFL